MINGNTVSKKDMYSIPMLVLWVGTKCSLKCKDCCNLIPYIKQKSFNIDFIIKDIKDLCKICRIEYLQIQGGELFTHPEIEKIIRTIDKLDIPRIWITSNGTMTLKENVLVALKKVKHPDFRITLSQYKDIGERQQKFCDVLIKNKIACNKYYFSTKVGRWLLIHRENKNNNNKKVQEIYDNCAFKVCTTLVDGRLFHCGNAYGSEEYFKIKFTNRENLDIRKLVINTGSNIEKSEIVKTFLEDKRFKEYCRYCLGTKGVKTVRGGIQITNQNKRIINYFRLFIKNLIK
ncbi:MAG: radical SAM protein [Candidatus Shapirobacteria bacterium]|jgi:hypothetical protein